MLSNIQSLEYFYCRQSVRSEDALANQGWFGRLACCDSIFSRSICPSLGPEETEEEVNQRERAINQDIEIRKSDQFTSTFGN